MKKVLVIDDEEIIRNKLKKLIEKEGFETLTAADGKEGLEIFHKEQPGLVITDITMPEVDGMEVLHTVKRTDPNCEVVLITGYGDFETSIKALREGVLDYLKKPIDLDQLLIALGRYREKCEQEKALSVAPSILLLEDEEVTRNKLVRILSAEG